MTTATQIMVDGCGPLWLVTGKDHVVACANQADCDRVKTLTAADINRQGKGFIVKGDARGAARWILKQFAGITADQFVPAPQGLAHQLWLKNH